MLHESSQVSDFCLAARAARSATVPNSELPSSISNFHAVSRRLNGSVVCDCVGGDSKFPYPCDAPDGPTLASFLTACRFRLT